MSNSLGTSQSLRQVLTGFHEFRHLRPYLSLGNCVEQQALGKNLSGLIVPGIAEAYTA